MRGRGLVVLGGLGSVFGPLAGTVAFLALEEVLSGITEYWAIPVGAILIAVALYTPQGVMGLLSRRRNHG